MNGLTLNNLKSPSQIFNAEGILFFPRLFEGEELERLLAACNHVLDQFLFEVDNPEALEGCEVRQPGLHEPTVDGNRNVYRMHHLNDPKWFEEHGEYWNYIMEAAADPRCLGPVEQVFRGESLFRGTSLFFNPRLESSEGDWHRDVQFVVPDEEAVKRYFAELNSTGVESFNGIQLQIALIETDDIEYVPFSCSRYDSPEEFHIRCADLRSHNRESGMPNAMRIHQRPGDALIFNANGLHRGRYHVERPRRTLMYTYTKRDSIFRDYFSDQPWLLKKGILDSLSPRCQAYFRSFIDEYRDYWSRK